MSEIDYSKEKAIPLLKSYLSAILNVNEKHFFFLPCDRGYLIVVEKKDICVWIHKSTVEGILKISFDVARDIAEQFIFSLIWGGSLVHDFIKGVIPDPPKETVIFMPKLYQIDHGTIVVNSGATGVFVKGLNAGKNVFDKAGKTVTNILNKEKPESKPQSSEKEPISEKTFTFLRFPDFLHKTISKEKMFKEKVFPNNGFEFRTPFNETASEFLKKVDKLGFTLNDKGNKPLI